MTEFGGYAFNVHLFKYCNGENNLGLNASATNPAGNVYHVYVATGMGYWAEWHNWTSPQNDTGFQWQPTFGGSGAGNVALLVASR